MELPRTFWTKMKCNVDVRKFKTYKPNDPFWVCCKNVQEIVERPLDEYINRIWLSVKDKDYKTITVCSKKEFKLNILKAFKND